VTWVGHPAFIGENGNTSYVLAEKPEANSPVRKHRCKWEHNIMIRSRKN
jgi:hypothetical protein